ncbi:DUF2732 family protein [Yersinia enterocolitica]|uniref:DUF2732 family protein n=1 Tax=Yersinia enterocolitica TaxID=630 RepID=UPI0005E90C07|nr:DUF2732 family protein [Yersinia enterocolitica]EKN3970547.1 DUF2732 family protein [Yersinia enterocolitica]EKN4802687.1 DUF2732 family protein [Yersinia enterocolitica]EKN4845868.1 DUF2732 family protein [Yersinia enterocolitica]EKN5117692.1 DUF2732 family protein [Yersinia enterocolitica]ELI8151716.1 DUF2732 family protein [Yersinia enterocolitica]
MTSKKFENADLLNDALINERRKQAILTSELLENLANVIIARALCVKESVELLRQESDKIQNQINE